MVLKTKEEIKAEIERLQGELAVLEKGDRLELGERFFYLDEFLAVNYYAEDGNEGDDFLFSIGNYYRTKEEAEKEARHKIFERKVAKRFKELNRGEYNFSNHAPNYFIRIDTVEEVCVPGDTIMWSNNTNRGWWSGSRGIVEKLIKELGEENFLKWSKGDL